jgi:TPR repeat protein
MKPLSKFALLAAISASLPAYAQTPDMRPTITIPSAAVSSAPDLAYGAYQRGYYVTAFKEAMTRIKANEQDAPAMTLIGQLYSEGLTVKRDVAEAARWFKLASDRGDRQGTFQLAVAAMEGSGILKDKAYAKE